MGFSLLRRMAAMRRLVLLSLVLPLITLAWRPAPAAAADPEEQPTIAPGSALAQLIKNNSEPMILAAVHASPGKVDVPAWLKVYYRKQHPRRVLPKKKTDPTQGYPLALEHIYAWMLKHQDLKASPA